MREMRVFSTTCNGSTTTRRYDIKLSTSSLGSQISDARCTEKTRVSSYGSILFWNRTLLATHAARGPDARRETEMGEGTEPNSRKHGTSVGMNTRLEHVPRVQYSPKEGTGLHAGTPHPKAYKSLILCCHHLRGVQRQTRKVEMRINNGMAATSCCPVQARHQRCAERKLALSERRHAASHEPELDEVG
jgi:hypothetical protein